MWLLTRVASMDFASVSGPPDLDHVVNAAAVGERSHAHAQSA